MEVDFQTKPSLETDVYGPYDDGYGTYDNDNEAGEEKKPKKKKKSKKASKEVDGEGVKKKKNSEDGMKRSKKASKRRSELAPDGLPEDDHLEDGLRRSKKTSKRRSELAPDRLPEDDHLEDGLKRSKKTSKPRSELIPDGLPLDGNSLPRRHHHHHHHPPARLKDDAVKDVPKTKPHPGRSKYQPTFNESTNPPTLQAERTINRETGEGIRNPSENDTSFITPLTVFKEPSLREDVEDPFVPVTTRFSRDSPPGNNSEPVQPGAQWKVIGQGDELRKLNREFRSSEPPRLDRKLSPHEKRRASLPPNLFPIEENHDQKQRTGPLSLFPVGETYDRGIGATTNEKSSHRLSYSTTGESYAQLDTESGGQGGTVDYVATRRSTDKNIRRKEDGPSYFGSSEEYNDENLRDNTHIPSPLDVEVQDGDRAGAFSLRPTGVLESTQDSEGLTEWMPAVDRVDQMSQAIREQQAVSVMDAVVDADIESDAPKEFKPTPWYCSRWIKALAAVMIIAGIAVGIAIPLSSSNDDDTDLFTDEQVDTRKEQLLGILTPVSTESQLLNETSPQYAALIWMASQDLMSPIENEARTPRETELLIQRYALAVFYYSTMGDNWFASDGWLDGQREECTWEYLDCVDEDVVSINTGTRNSLVGKLPSELNQLKQLRFLILPSNAITGFSKGMGSLPNLIQLDLSGNKMGGTIPTEIYEFTALRQLFLMENSFTGVLSPFITNLVELTELVLDQNKLTGTLTTEFQSLVHLSFLDLGNNEFLGNFNTVFQGMDTLVVLFLTRNRITGSLASDIQQLSSLEHLDLIDTDIAGTIPSEIGTLTNLRSLLLEGLGLTGTIPTDLGKLSLLSTLYLVTNNLEGPVPTELCSLPNLTDVSFDYCRNECQCQFCSQCR